MAFTLRIILVAVALNTVHGGGKNISLPTIDLEEWWASGLPVDDEDKNVNDFLIEFPDEFVSDLKTRLLSHRTFHPPLEGVAFNYGMNTTALEYWIQYLANDYNFTDRQAYLNQYSHYTTCIQGLPIHFVRITQNVTSTTPLVPLMLLHGWPGSIREFYETVPYLLSYAELEGIALDIIIPSLPGFGFSSAAVRPGLGADKACIMMNNLMKRIGYTQYYVHGGDLGAIIGSIMATFFPNAVLGYHTNYPLIHTLDMIFNLIIGNYHKDEITTPDLQDRLYPSWDIFFKIMTETGYLHEQATKPDTVGFGLTDSPSALMGYTLEKFSVWVRKEFINRTDGGLTQIFNEDQLLDNYMIYYLSNCITTSMRLFAETFNKRFYNLRLFDIPTSVPAWVLQAPDEMIYLPGWMIKQKFPNLLNITLPSEGGHFYAWEQPQLFAQDVVNALVAFRSWHEMNSTLYTQCSDYFDN